MLKDKVAFITGSTRGIGWAIAQKFAENRCSVILNGINDKKNLEQCRKEIENRYKIDCISFLGDVSDRGQLENCYKEIFKRFKRLDILVNNAGIMEDSLLGLIQGNLVEKTFSTNTYSVIYNTQLAMRIMMRHQKGSIINISSIIGVEGNPGQVVYSGSKAAIIGITKSSAKELAYCNIRVNCITPGFIETDLSKNLTDEVVKDKISAIGFKKPGQPEDIANTTLFLASDNSSYITGQIIGVDGGMVI